MRIGRGFLDRVQGQQPQRLHGSIDHGRYTQRTLFSVRFGDIEASQRLGPITPLIEQSYPLRFRLRCAPGLSIYAGRSFSSVFGDLPYRHRFGEERAREKPLQGFHLTPVPRFNGLHDTSLQPVDGALRAAPVNLAPVAVPARGRGSC